MPLSSGDLLANKYRIEAEIGRGAFGRVYRARDLALDRVVAIKELHKGEDDLGSTQFSDYVRRFEREARVQARFNHPNIVHVYELLRLADDRLYLAMEYVDGESLRDYLARRGPLPVDEAVRIMLDLLAGLAAVHADERDIVHRDIKPSNVMLTKSGQAKLADFGLAQVGDESLRSGAGQPHPGSPLYMSPEQETTNAYLYPASDVFSAGCVLFELLTGTVYKQAKRRKQGLVDLRANTPPWLAEVVARALVREADDRPADAGELRQVLAEAAHAAADAERQQKEAAEQARREAARAAEFSAILAELEQARAAQDWPKLADLGHRLLLETKVSDEIRKAARWAVAEGYYNWEEATLKTHDFAPQLVVLAQRLAATPDSPDCTWLRGVLLTEQAMFQGQTVWAEAIAELTRAIGLLPLEFSYYFVRGVAHHYAVMKQQAVGSIDQALSDKTRAIELDPTRAVLYCSRGNSYSWKRDHDLAIADHTKAIELDPARADYYHQRGANYRHKGEYDRAIAEITKAIELAPDKPDYWQSRGVSYHNQGDYDRAIADYTKAIELAPDKPDYYVERGKSYMYSGIHERAIADLSRAIELEPSRATFYCQRGMIYNNQRVRTGNGDFAHAIADYNKAIELDPTTANYYFELGLVYWNLWNLTGEETLQNAIDNYCKTIELDPNNSDYYHTRGISYFERRDYDRAIADYSRAIELAPDKPDYYVERGRSYHQINDHDRAIADFSKAIELAPTAANYYHWRGTCHHAKGDYDQAIADYSKAIELDSTESGYWESRGMSYHFRGDFGSAIADYSRALELDPTRPDCYALRAHCYSNTGDYDSAIASFSEAIRYNPTRDAYFKLRGETYRMMGKHARADEDLAKARELGYKG